MPVVELADNAEIELAVVELAVVRVVADEVVAVVVVTVTVVVLGVKIVVTLVAVVPRAVGVCEFKHLSSQCPHSPDKYSPADPTRVEHQGAIQLAVVHLSYRTPSYTNGNTHLNPSIVRHVHDLLWPAAG